MHFAPGVFTALAMGVLALGLGAAYYWDSRWARMGGYMVAAVLAWAEVELRGERHPAALVFWVSLLPGIALPVYPEWKCVESEEV